MKKYEHKISRVLPESIAEELEIESGDTLLEIDGKKVEEGTIPEILQRTQTDDLEEAFFRLYQKYGKAV